MIFKKPLIYNPEKPFTEEELKQREEYNKYKYVYLHVNRKNLEPFYCGIGRLERAYNFKNRSKSYLRFIERNGEPLVVILSAGNELNQAYELEKYIIRLYGRKSEGGKLLNYAKGGRTPEYYKPTNPKGIEYDRTLKMWRVYIYTKKGKIYAGRTDNKERALSRLNMLNQYRDDNGLWKLRAFINKLLKIN